MLGHVQHVNRVQFFFVGMIIDSSFCPISGATATNKFNFSTQLLLGQGQFHGGFGYFRPFPIAEQVQYFELFHLFSD
jgi:hypothetical protein